MNTIILNNLIRYIIRYNISFIVLQNNDVNLAYRTFAKEKQINKM